MVVICCGARNSRGTMGAGLIITLPVILFYLLLLDTPVPAIATFNFPHCGVCDESKCPALHYCEGQAIKDHCQCCMICSDHSFQPHISLATQPKTGDACEQVDCPNLKVCVENVQGLPLCECPGEHMCRRSRKKDICGTDGMTYKSRCHMRISSCNHGVHIRKAYRGVCKDEDKPTDAAAYRKKLKKLKRKLRKRRQKKRGLSSSGKKRYDDETQRRRKEKRRRRRRKTHNKGNSKKRNKRHKSKSHKKINFDKLRWENNFGLATWN